MENISRHRFILLLTIMVLGLVFAIFFYSRSEQTMIRESASRNVVHDTIARPITTHVDVGDGRKFAAIGEPTPIAPKDGQVIPVVGANWTMKEGYGHVLPDAQKWSSDALLVYVRSLGTITSDGKSSAWQYVFGSKSKKAAYEMIVEGSTVATKKEVQTSTFGYDLPVNWYDSSDAIISLRDLSQFSSGTLSAMTFFWDTDARLWQYALITSRGTVSMPVK